MFGKFRAAALAVVLLGAAAFAITLVSGLLYERVQRARDLERYPQIGRSIDIGGRSMNLFCSGTGQPAVILQSGSNWYSGDPKTVFRTGSPRPGYSWVWIQRQMAQVTTSCWFDRAGAGWSELGPYPRDSSAQARDLHALLRGAGIAPPYVLVAEASAALDARVYGALYPQDAAGLVLVDGVHPDFLTRSRPGTRRLARLPRFVSRMQDVEAQFINQVGFFRLAPVLPPQPRPNELTEPEWDTIRHLAQSARAHSALLQDIAAWQLSTAEARDAGALGNRPLAVLSSDDATPPETLAVWREQEANLAALSSRGKLVPLGEIGGDAIYQAPEAIVAAARMMVEELRKNPTEVR